MAIIVCIFSSLLGFGAVTVQLLIFNITFWQGCATYFGVSAVTCILIGIFAALRSNLPESSGNPLKLQTD